MLANTGRHDEENDCRGHSSRRERNRSEATTMSPMEVMALAKKAQFATADSGAGIKKPIADVDSPGPQRQKNGNPEGKSDVCNARESERPDDSDGGRIKAGEMP